MRKLLYVLLFVVMSCSAQEPENLNHMDSAKWKADITELNKIIQEEFETYQPDLKAVFAQNTEVLLKELNNLSNEEIAIRMGQLIAGLDNGHTELSVMQAVAGFKRLPLALYFFEDGAYIYAAQEKYQNIIGAKIQKIGTKSIPEVLELLETIMTHDNQYEILHAGPTFMLSPEVLLFLGIIQDKEKVKLQLEMESGESKIKTLEPVSLSDYRTGVWKSYLQLNDVKQTLAQKNLDKKYWYEYLPEEKTMYLYLGQINNQKGEPSLKKFFKNLFSDFDKVSAQKLVIDLRQNTGGENSKSKPLIEAIKERPSLNQEGNIYLITGRMTFSAAMATSVFLKRQTNALLIGEPSRGNPNKSDNVEHKRLAHSRLLLEYTTRLKKHWPELGDLDHVPVDIEVSKSFQDFKNGSDPVLEYIFNR